MNASNLSIYIDLIDSFLGNRISVAEFERQYIHLFKNDGTMWQGVEYEALNDLFGDVDAFCDVPELRGPDDLNEDQLRQRCRIALTQLQICANV